ncbi:MAG: putative repeat protein (TIGR03806 family) [Chitinophagales bacterium]
MRVFKLLIIFTVLLVLSQCGKDNLDSTDINIPEGKGHSSLSTYNFFEGNVADLIPNAEAGVLPYDLNMPLFSDYALKKRYIYVPPGVSIPFDTTQILDLPVGAVLIKHFYYSDASGIEDYVETRLLIRKNDGWQAETYEWNDEQTEATRTIIGGTRTMTAMVNGQTETFNYLIPNVNQCKNCHADDGEIEPIGPAIHNLNKSYDYSSGTANQIDRWISDGILENTSLSNIPAWPGMNHPTASLTSKARAYLAVNCSSCHRLEGSAANSGLYLEYDNQDSLSLGFWKTPIAAGGGSGGLTYVIKPSVADESILLYRMISDEVDERMPEIGRSLSHEEGISLIRDWIDAQ